MTLGRPAIKIVATFRAETGGAEQRAHPEYLWALGPGFGTGTSSARTLTFHPTRQRYVNTYLAMRVSFMIRSQQRF